MPVGIENEELAYREILPDSRLRHFVECYWMTKSRAAHPAFRPVLPDGCSDILFNFSTPLLSLHDGRVSENAFHAFYVGIQTMPVLTRSSGPTDLLGVRFRNLGAWHLLQRPLNEFINTIASLEELGEWGLNELAEQLAFLPVPERVDKLQSFLLRRLANDRPLDIFDQFVDNPKGTLRQFCKVNRISERTLERKLQERVGLSPKMYQRVVRFRKAADRLPGFSGSLMELAWDMGYYDHAHLTKEFREFGHFVPSGLLD